MCSPTHWIKACCFYLDAGLESTHIHRRSESSHYIASSVYREGRLARQSLYCGLVSVDPYHAPPGNAGLCKCLQISIFLK